MTDATPHDDHRIAALLALSALPGMGPRRLAAMLAEHSPEHAWALVALGTCTHPAGRSRGNGDECVRPPVTPTQLTTWRRDAAQIDPIVLLDRHRSLGLTVLERGAAGFPPSLEHDPEPPALLTVHGDATLFERSGPRVAIVGTRRATRYGIDIARSIGHALAAAGVTVVSGLALGIDGAAHRGALDATAGAPPIAIVGTGLDVVYPRQHASLWRALRERGAIASEAPLGTRGEPWRFPARNRLIAGLAHLIVVVESPERGGSLHTVDEALRRDRPVLAVPGPITSHASRGTNRLIADGATPVTSVDDILVALGITPTAPAARPPAPTSSERLGVSVCNEAHPPPHLSAHAVTILDTFDCLAVSLEDLVQRTRLPMTEIGAALAELEGVGIVHRAGLWYERSQRSAVDQGRPPDEHPASAERRW